MKIALKKLNLTHATQKYLKWLNNYNVVKFTDQIFKQHSLKLLKKYILNLNKSKFNFLYGIFIVTEKKQIHIGNIKIGDINYYHRTAVVSLLIGESKYWKKGIATKSINLVKKIAKNELGLYKLYAGCYKENIPSQKAFLKNKYKKEGVQKNQIIVGNKRSDLIWYGLVLKK